ncbi:MAG: amidohydrolase [Sphingomonas sp.]
MMLGRLAAGILSMVALLGAAASTAGPGHGYADLLFTGGKVITVDGQDRIADGVAVRGNRIVAVGDVGAWRGPDTRVVDLEGRVLLPGFIDAHSHVAGMAEVETRYVNIQVPPLKDPAAIIATLKRAQAGKPPGAWLIGQGTYNQAMPTRAQLDAAFPDTPVRLDWSAHDHLINHAAALAMGMTGDFPDPPKGTIGRYERNADGEVTIIRDAPAPWPKAPLSYAELKEGVREILQRFYLEKGVTTVSDLSGAPAFRAYQELNSEGRLPTRVRLNYMVRDPALMDALMASGIYTGFGSDRVRVGAIKLVLDGVWGTTAAVYKSFWEGSGTTWIEDNHGGTSLDQAELNAIVLRARKAGWQIEVHANGDRAQDMVLDALEAANIASPKQDSRDRIEHFAHFLVEDPARTAKRLERMRRDGVIPSLQPAFLWRLTNTNVKEPGVDFFPLRKLIDMGFEPAGGVDTIGTQNFATYPMFSIQRAVARDTKYGRVVQPEQAITTLEGIKMFTIWSARANFLEKSLGSIEVGKLADFVLLARDPLTVPVRELSSIPVDMTVLDGKVVYERR